VPPGWVGIVVLGDAALVTAPDHDTARFVEQALSGLPASSLTDAGVLSSRLPVAEILGPAALAYLNPAEFCPQPGVTPSPRCARGRQSPAAHDLVSKVTGLARE
jgi:hypothetical protein